MTTTLVIPVVSGFEDQSSKIFALLCALDAAETPLTAADIFSIELTVYDRDDKKHPVVEDLSITPASVIFSDLEAPEGWQDERPPNFFYVTNAAYYPKEGRTYRNLFTVTLTGDDPKPKLRFASDYRTDGDALDD